MLAVLSGGRGSTSAGLERFVTSLRTPDTADGSLHRVHARLPASRRPRALAHARFADNFTMHLFVCPGHRRRAVDTPATGGKHRHFHRVLQQCAHRPSLAAPRDRVARSIAVGIAWARLIAGEFVARQTSVAITIKAGEVLAQDGIGTGLG